MRIWLVIVSLCAVPFDAMVAQSASRNSDSSASIFTGVIGVYHSDKNLGEKDIVAGTLGIEIKQETSDFLDVSGALLLLSHDSFGCPSAAFIGEMDVRFSNNFGIYGRGGPILKCGDLQKSYGAYLWAESGLRFNTTNWSVDLGLIPDEKPGAILTIRRSFSLWD